LVLFIGKLVKPPIFIEVIVLFPPQRCQTSELHYR